MISTIITIAWTALCLGTLAVYLVYTTIEGAKAEKRYEHYVNELDDAFEW